MHTADYSSLLSGVARELALECVKPAGLGSIVLTGSVAKGCADAYSDIELILLWEQPPAAEARAAVFNDVTKQPLFTEAQEDGGWTTAFVYKNVKIDIFHADMSFLRSTINDVMSSRVTSIVSQTLLCAIQDGRALHGEEVLKGLQANIANYPDELSEKCIRVNLSFPEWSLRNALLERNDVVALHHLVDMTLLQMMRLLFALNKHYLSSYNMKWLHYYAAKLSIKPERLEERVTAALAAPNQQAVQELDSLLRETLGLVAQHRPNMDISEELRTFEYVRQKISAE